MSLDEQNEKEMKGDKESIQIENISRVNMNCELIIDEFISLNTIRYKWYNKNKL